jgi:hypothetical protein
MTSVDDPSISYRNNKNTLIPYYCYPLSQSNSKINIDEIILGPHPNERLAVNSVFAFARKTGLGTTSVRSSQIPYREM